MCIYMERRKCWSLKRRKGREGNSRAKNIAFDSLHADLNPSSPSLFITFHARCNRFCGKRCPTVPWQWTRWTWRVTFYALGAYVMTKTLLPNGKFGLYLLQVPARCFLCKRGVFSCSRSKCLDCTSGTLLWNTSVLGLRTRTVNNCENNIRLVEWAAILIFRPTQDFRLIYKIADGIGLTEKKAH